MTHPSARVATQHFPMFVSLMLVISGCSTMPSFGPSASAINGAATDVSTEVGDVLPFRIIDVSAMTLPTSGVVVKQFPAPFRSQRFRKSDEIVEVGDRLAIRIWEVAEDGLFATAGRRETLLDVVVSNSGNISVPYTRLIAAVGLTTAELRAVLLERYKGQAIEPEIAVAITETQSRSVTVLGAVVRPGLVTMPLRGMKLLDLMAQVGGTAQPTWEITVTIQRGSSRSSLPLSAILASPSNNVVILPGDTIDIGHEPRRFSVYGAIRKPGNIEISLEQANLAYLIAEAGGLNDHVAQARSAFVFRTHLPGAAGEVPSAIAYRFDFSRPDALMLAGMFALEPTDITYIASADAADFNRFVSIVLSPLLGSASRASNLGN